MLLGVVGLETETRMIFGYQNPKKVTSVYGSIWGKSACAGACAVFQGSYWSKPTYNTQMSIKCRASLG